MKRRTAFALTVVAMLLSASLVMAQGSAPSTSGTAAKGAKPAAGAVATTKTAAATAQAKPVVATTQAKPVVAATQAKPVVATTQAKPVVAATQAKPVVATTQAKSAPTAAAAGALVDLNSASKADLMKLPGIGEAISAKIIAGRPWANKAQLLAKGLVTKPAYDKLSARVIAKQAK